MEEKRKFCDKCGFEAFEFSDEPDYKSIGVNRVCTDCYEDICDRCGGSGVVEITGESDSDECGVIGEQKCECLE